MERDPTTLDERPTPHGAPPAGRAPLAARGGPAHGAPAGAATPDRQRPTRLLFTGWLLYWLALLAVQLWPVAVRWWEIRGQEHGTLSFTFSGDGSTLAWIVVPPLLMAVVWMLATREKGR